MMNFKMQYQLNKLIDQKNKFNFRILFKTNWKFLQRKNKILKFNKLLINKMKNSILIKFFMFKVNKLKAFKILINNLKKKVSLIFYLIVKN